MFKGDYIEDTLSNVVTHMTPDQKKQALLMKRLKGKYKQDQKEHLEVHRPQRKKKRVIMHSLYRMLWLIKIS